MQSSLSSSEMAARLRSYERRSETDVILVLPGEKANRDFVRLVVEENQAGPPFRLDDLPLLNQLWLKRHLAVSEAAFVIQKPIAEARSNERFIS
jgi:ATP-dependent DNA helicase RecG